MSERRKHIGFKTKLAAALCSLVKPDGNGSWAKIIPHEDAKKMSEDQVLALFEWDHFPVPKAFGGPDTHWNLDPIPKQGHRTKTAMIDIPRIAKAKRIEKREASHVEAITMKAERREERKTSKWPKGRKIQSKGFERRKDK